MPCSGTTVGLVVHINTDPLYITHVSNQSCSMPPNQSPVAYADKLMDVLREVRKRIITGRRTGKAPMNDFLCFVCCPDEFESPRSKLKPLLINMVAAYRRAD